MHRPDAGDSLPALLGTTPPLSDRLPWPVAARVILVATLAFWGAVGALLLALIG